MTIIEGLVYLMLSMVLGSAIVSVDDSKGDAKFCFMCVEMEATKKSSKEPLAPPDSYNSYDQDGSATKYEDNASPEQIP